MVRWSEMTSGCLLATGYSGCFAVLRPGVRLAGFWPGISPALGWVPVGLGPGAGGVLVPDWRGCRVVRG